MRPSRIVVGDISLQGVTQVTLIHDQQAAQTLFANRTHPARGKCIRVRCSIRCVDDIDPLGLKNGVEGCRELGIPIVD
jgi:hypothetical protein